MLPKAHEAQGNLEKETPTASHTQLPYLILGMAASEGEATKEEYVYRISSAEEWQELQNSGSIFGGELDKTSGFIHLSNLNQVSLKFYEKLGVLGLKKTFLIKSLLDLMGPRLSLNEINSGCVLMRLNRLCLQVQSTLQNFFLNTKVDLYLLQIDAKKVHICVHLLLCFYSYSVL